MLVQMQTLLYIKFKWNFIKSSAHHKTFVHNKIWTFVDTENV
jgi:hypothetical protein